MEKKHREIPSSSLIPENDPTSLFISAGMQPLVPYFLEEKNPVGNRIVNVQKCIRTGDIEDVGDKTHHTFFEMLGNWSFGDYFKEEAIKFSFEFFTKVLNFDKKNMGITVFGGDDRVQEIPADNESSKIWESLGISKNRIVFLKRGVLEKQNNWWGPIGENGPCGPCTEIFYWIGKGKIPEKFNPNNDQWVEIGNDVLIQYEKKGKSFIPLKKKSIDFGGGVERILSILQGLDDDYKTSIFWPIIQEIEKISNEVYEGNERLMRIIADHLRASVFILGDEKAIRPGNIGQGYVLRRLIRRAIRYGRLLGIKNNFCVKIAKTILPLYHDYQELERNKKFIFEELDKEEERFKKTLEKGLKKFEEICKDEIITGKEAFLLFQSFGFPIEMTQELANEKGIKLDLEGYNEEFKKHQDLSRTASAGQFKSGLADDSEAVRKLHTATHLLNEALRRVLGREIKQKGSNITPQRLRFDFNFDRKLKEEEKEKIENLVNEKISRGLRVIREEMPLENAIKSGAQAEFEVKYPEMVSVYTILDEKEEKGWFSKEICTGPHVKNTSRLGKFRIIKEESCAAGVRRIKAILE